MSTCRCCGQHIEAAAQTAAPSQVVRVDDAVLAVCNTAFEQARQRGHAHVEIAHAVLAIAMSESGAAVLRGRGLDAQQTGRAADEWLASWANKRGQGEALATSAEFKSLLRAAEEQAQRAGRTHASLDDVLAALTAQAGSLWSASFWSAAAGREQDRDGHLATRTDRQVQETSGAQTLQLLRTAAVASAQAQASLLDRDYAWLRDMKRASAASGTQAVSRTPSAPAATAAPGTRQAAASTADALVSLVAASPATRKAKAGDRAAAPTSGRVMHLFASTPAGAPSKTPPATREDAASQSILQRLDMQERSLAQRLDTQQRMIAELAEAFARTMRELTEARSEAAAAQARAAAQVARTHAATGSAHEADGSGASRSSDSSSQRSGAQRSRSVRGTWRRQSWIAWRRRRGLSNHEAERNTAEYGFDSTPRPAPDHLRQPRAERAPRLAREPRADYALRENAVLPQREPVQTISPRVSESEQDETGEREKRFYLALDDEIEKAPSIGPRSAALLNAVGIMTVRDLLTCDTANIAARLHNRYITADRLTQWQAQSRLVCTIPWLRGTHAQLLAGAGYDTIEKIAAADAPGVCAAILKFAATRDGMSVLRSSPPPGEDWVIKRLEHARAAEPERAVA